MSDEHKTRGQLLQEIAMLRRQISDLAIGAGREAAQILTGADVRSGPRAEESTESLQDLVWEMDDFRLPAMDEQTDAGAGVESPRAKGAHTAGLDYQFALTRDVTESGSFDLRWLRLASFGKLLEAIPMPILLVDCYGTIQLGNKAFENLSQGADSVRGDSFYALFPDPHEMRLAENLLENVLILRKPEFREGMLRLGGREIWSRMSLRSIRFGAERSVLVLIEDLTAEKRELLANEKYRKLVSVIPIGTAEFIPTKPVFCDSLPDQILKAIPEARAAGGNLELARILGLPRVEDIEGARIKDVFPFDEREVPLCENWIRNGLSVASKESKETDAAGEVKYYDNTLVGIVQECRLLQFWGLRQDVTERKRVQEELMEKIRIIDELYEHILQTREAKAIANHTAKVAHELRQPLAIIGGFARRMAKECDSCHKVPSRDRGEPFGIIVREVRRLEDILTGLIDFTQRRTVELESINPNEVIQYVLRINSERLTERGLRVEISLGEEVAEILVDRERFEQVVRNLLAYAVDTSAPNDVLRVETGISCLSLKAQQTGDLDSDAYFEMKIYHRGKVIPEEDLTRLFNPFVTTRDYGTGIGLTIAKKIIEDHKGSISVKSETEGTLFTIWLPLNRPVTSGSE